MTQTSRIALRIEQDLPCPDCGYNLRGMGLDGRCPECGRATIETFTRPLGAGDGEFAERLVRRPATGVLWLALLGFAGDAVPLLAGLNSPMGVYAGALGAAGGIGGLLVARAWDDVRQARRWDVGSAVEDVAGYWRAAMTVAAVLAFALPAAACWGGIADFATSAVAAALFGAASLAALAALALGGTSVATLLKRFAHGGDARPLAASLTAFAALLLGSAAVPITNLALATLAGVGGLVGLVGLLISWLLLVNRLRAAQRGIAGLGRRRRASSFHERPAAGR